MAATTSPEVRNHTVARREFCPWHPIPSSCSVQKTIQSRDPIVDRATVHQREPHRPRNRVLSRPPEGFAPYTIMMAQTFDTWPKGEHLDRLRVHKKVREAPNPNVLKGQYRLKNRAVAASEDADDEEDDDSDDVEFIGPASRLPRVQHPRVQHAHASMQSSSAPRQAPRTAARKSLLNAAEQPIIISDDSDNDTVKDAGEIPQLAFAFSRLDLKNYGAQNVHRLPFLRRNLRRALSLHCARHNVSLEERPPFLPVQILFRHTIGHGVSSSDSDESDDPDVPGKFEERRATMTSWRCPCCSTHGDFKNRDVLQFHLKWDHPKVDVKWEDDVSSEFACKLIVTLDSALMTSESSSEPSDDDSVFEYPDQHVTPLAPAMAGLKVEEDPDAQAAALNLPLKTEPGIDDALPEPQLQDTQFTSQIRLKFIERPPSPVLSSVQPTAPRIDPSTYRGSLPAKYPDPPPPTDPLGPAAQYPFLPDGEFSCRPGGPRIFDLLSKLPLEGFGVLSWMITDRDEEIYELDDVRDEDKTMLALWNRWIFLNRRKFIYEGHFVGATAFIVDYWKTIHQAAGWRALRSFLLMLMVNKYLNTSEVAKLLKQYEGKTGMDLWYK
ncbi:hypothetical protein EIP91_009568 [Steccherinum ochraceum]|uniref:Uncharacterized protein n=1 Tax=Steccherinum ochraceum TaxID=92696 RepID=A0A4R0RZT1_9APHY|nr:hypothetical protein EIP91_009568 [Steccherinum ochraceum]